MMFRAYPQNFCVALGAIFFLARHTAIVRHNRVAFWADALSTAAHRVLAIPFSHFVSPELVLGLRYRRLQVVIQANTDADPLGAVVVVQQTFTVSVEVDEIQSQLLPQRQ